MEQRTDGLAVGNEPAKARRGSWTVEQKRQIVAESHLAGANLAEVAQRHGVRVALVSSWRRYFLRTSPTAERSAKFVPVRVGSVPTDGVIEIDLTTGCVRVRGIVDGRMLREVLAATR
jgi:transposase-like protein